jgi:hypothetical protein
MARPIKTGRVLETGVITAEDQRAAIGAAAQPREGKVALSPAQQRKLENDEYPGEPPEGYEVTILEGRELYDLWGAPELAAAPGSPDGATVPIPPPPNATRKPTDWDKIDGDGGSEAAADADYEADKLRRDFRAHAQKVTKRAIAAKGTDSEAAAVVDVKRATELGRELKARLGSL